MLFLAQVPTVEKVKTLAKFARKYINRQALKKKRI